MSCLFAVTTDLPLPRLLRTQESIGLMPPVTSTTICAGELRMSSKFSVHTTEPGTYRAASEARFRFTLLLKICVSSTPGIFLSASKRATALPTVPKPSRATLTVAAGEAVVVFVEAAAVFRGVFRLVISVFDPIGLGAPWFETLDCPVTQQARCRDTALVEGTLHLFVEKRIVEAGGSSIGGGVAVENRIATRPVERRQAHRAGLTTGVDHATPELKVTERFARRANGDDLCVGRGVVDGGHQVDTGGDDLARAYDHRAKRTARAGDDVLRRQRDGSLHED